MPENPQEYFSSWSAASLNAGSVARLGEDEALAINQHKLQPVPVPFPPKTSLSIEIKGNRKSGAKFADWSDQRTVGGTTAAAPVTEWDQLTGDGSTGWPAFAVLSNALPVINTFSEIPDDAQRRAAIQGLISVFAEIQKVWGTPGAPPPSSQADPRWIVWTGLVQPNIATTPLSSSSAWLDILNRSHSPNVSNAAWAYDQLVGKTYTDDPRVNLPRAVWPADALSARGGLFLGDPAPAARSYLDALWAELRASIPKYPEPQEFIQLLGRMFGFGERLAWPLAKLDNGSIEASKRFMVLRPDLSGTGNYPTWIKPEHWCATNLVSLAGQVFRMGPSIPPILRST